MRAPLTGTTATLSKVHASPARTVFQEGLLAGTCGAATMTFWFLLLDGVAGHPLYTPNMLGTALFHGGGGLMPSAHSAFSLGMVGACTATYWLLCVLLGALAAQEPNLGFGVLLGFVLTTAGLVGGAMLCAEPVLHGLAWPAVLLGHLGAVGAMGGSLWRRHAPLVIYP